jgi:hypothetical protein
MENSSWNARKIRSENNPTPSVIGLKMMTERHCKGKADLGWEKKPKTCTPTGFGLHSIHPQ